MEDSSEMRQVLEAALKAVELFRRPVDVYRFLDVKSLLTPGTGDLGSTPFTGRSQGHGKHDSVSRTLFSRLRSGHQASRCEHNLDAVVFLVVENFIAVRRCI
jgi:hypothetical protein